MYSHCLRCNRILKNPVSRETGYGAICRAKVRAIETEHEDHDRYDLPFAGDIVCRREANGNRGRLHFNIPPTVFHHGSTWEWGYGGSGPAEFALNILHFYVRPDGTTPTIKTRNGEVVREDVYLAHQAFKWAFISPLPEAGGTISGEAIREWFAANRVTQIRFAA